VNTHALRLRIVVLTCRQSSWGLSYETKAQLTSAAMNDQKGKHPVVDYLERRISQVGDRGGKVIVEEAVLKHGRQFTAIERPKEFRLGALKRCFANAGDVACREKGIYVEGFVISSQTVFPIHHAWITLDGIHAIDVTLRGAVQNYSYFGIPFSLRVLEKWSARRGYWELLDELADLDELQSDAARYLATFENL
jgi:hypothetical protein